MAVKPIPEGYSPVTPYLIVRDADAVLTFVKSAFGADVKEEHRMPDGTVMHAVFAIAGAPVMMGQANDRWPERPAMLHVYVPDADATYARALKAGGKSIQDMTTQFYGDRSGGVEDPSGVVWWIATHVEDVAPEEIERRAKAQRG